MNRPNAYERGPLVTYDCPKCGHRVRDSLGPDGFVCPVATCGGRMRLTSTLVLAEWWERVWWQAALTRGGWMDASGRVLMPPSEWRVVRRYKAARDRLTRLWGRGLN